MKRYIGLVAIAALFVGCGGGSTSSTSGSNANYTSVQSALDAPKSNLTQEAKDTLSFMGNEERLAYDVYLELYSKWGSKQFYNIATKSEYKHIKAVQDLVKKYGFTDNDFSNVDLNPLGLRDKNIESMPKGNYDISHIQDLYNSLIAKGEQSKVDALQVGCMVEVVDVNDLNEKIDIAKASNASDLVTVFEFLRQGSYNHYWAFDKGLKNEGISDGCCSLGSEYCKTPEEYPSNKGGNGKGKN